MQNQEYEHITNFKAAYIELCQDLEEYLEGDFFQNAISKEYTDTISFDIAVLMEKSARQDHPYSEFREREEL